MENRCPRVLIVDDERTIADTLVLIFSGNGYETRASYSAEQALEIVADWLPDLAILDVVLPRMNGVELAILLTTRCPTCRLLLLSGQSLTSDILTEAAMRGYTFDILAKPTHPTALLDAALNMIPAKPSKQGLKPATSGEFWSAHSDPSSDS